MSGRFDVGVSGLRTTARRGFWIVGSARRRASGFRSIARTRSRLCIASVTGASPPSTFTSIWWRGTTSPGATPGRRRSFIRRVFWRRRSGAHRRKRPRRPMPGMMLHQDGSRHVWLDGQPALDLIVTLDDATGAIYSAFLVEEEGTASTFRALSETFGAHGLPMSLYTDRGAHYFHTAETGGKIDRSRPTQVGRALEQLSVEPIGAYSPQARGRSERAFQTVQDRLVKELRLAGITSIEAANAFIREVYLPADNERFAAPAAEPGSAFTSIPGVDLDEILCVQEERQVGNDNCVSYRTLKLQIPESPLRPHFVKARVKVHVYPDGSHALFHGPRCIGRYDGKGDPGCEKRRLNPLGGAPVEMGTTPRRCPQSHRRTEPEEAD